MNVVEESCYVPWFVERGFGPLLAVALHDGHAVRDEVRAFLALDELARLREEDPFTAVWTSVAPSRVVVSQSRFEFDLNRPREKAVYRTPEDAWGLQIWDGDLPAPMVARSLAIYDSFYQEIEILLKRMVSRYGKVVILDFHSYNYRRNGPEGDIDEQRYPEINVGTGTMNRILWNPVVDRFIADLGSFDFCGRHLDVRENIVFRGGNLARWVHTHFSDTVCVIAIEVRKFFMDEWTGKPDQSSIDGLLRAFKSSVWGIYEELGSMRRAAGEAELRI